MKRPIVFWDPEETEILRKLNIYEREKQDILKDKNNASNKREFFKVWKEILRKYREWIYK